MKTQKQLIKLGEKLANHPISQNLIKSPIKTRNQTALNPLLKKGGVMYAEKNGQKYLVN